MIFKTLRIGYHYKERKQQQNVKVCYLKREMRILSFLNAFHTYKSEYRNRTKEKIGIY